MAQIEYLVFKDNTPVSGAYGLRAVVVAGSPREAIDVYIAECEMQEIGDVALWAACPSRFWTIEEKEVEQTILTQTREGKLPDTLKRIAAPPPRKRKAAAEAPATDGESEQQT